MSNIQAAMLLGQLERLDDQWEKREKICRIYEHAFSEMKGVSFPVVPQNAKSARHLFTIWVDPSRRDEILLRLQEQGVGVAVNYRAIHLLQYYREKFGFKRGDYPQAEHIGDSTITLPLYSKLTDKEIKYVIEAVKKALD
jgi:UDP-4-amino-4-deoxy-L-arabinose-oxoglutarate aminotransferase